MRRMPCSGWWSARRPSRRWKRCAAATAMVQGLHCIPSNALQTYQLLRNACHPELEDQRNPAGSTCQGFIARPAAIRVDALWTLQLLYQSRRWRTCWSTTCSGRRRCRARASGCWRAPATWRSRSASPSPPAASRCSHPPTRSGLCGVETWRDQSISTSMSARLCFPMCSASVSAESHAEHVAGVAKMGPRVMVRLSSICTCSCAIARLQVNRLELTLSIGSFAAALGAMIAGIFGELTRCCARLSISPSERP